MYALRLWGARLAVAADDLAVPALIEAFWRVLWLLGSVVFVVTALDRTQDGVPGRGCGDVVVFSIVMTVLVAVSLAVYLVGFVLANRGSIHEPEKRAGIVVPIKVLFGVYALMVVAMCVGAWLASTFSEESCNDSALFSLTVASVVGVAVDSTIFFCFWYLVLNREGKLDTSKMRSEFEIKTIEWQARCNKWCNVAYYCTFGCYGYHVKGGEAIDTAYGQVAEVFAAWFTGVKITPMELLVGIALVRAEQREVREVRKSEVLGKGLSVVVEEPEDIPPLQLHQSAPKSKIKVLPKFEAMPSAYRDDNNPAEMARVMRELHEVLPYSEAMNTWKLYMLTSLLKGKPLHGAKELIVGALHRSRHRRGRRDQHAGDNCCSWNHSAFVKTTEIQTEDLVFSQFISYAAELVAFAVAVDHKTKKVVLGFRGSLALSDFLTDAALQPTNLHEAGQKYGFNGDKHYCHGGMLAAALKIREILDHTGVLRVMFNGGGANAPKGDVDDAGTSLSEFEMSSTFVKDDLPDCTGYRLILVGESLGAGISAVTSLLLKADYPELKGYGFSTPGCMFSRNLAEEVSSYFTSVFVGKDLVPRANWQSLEKIRTDVLDALSRCKCNKNLALRSLFRNVPSSKMLYTSFESVPSNEGVERLHEMMRVADESSRTEANHITHMPMFCPGLILHLAKTQTVVAPRTCVPCIPRKKRSYEPFFVRDRQDLCEFVFSKDMAMDHGPWRVSAALLDTVDFC
ncbi:Diacylglycerol lipase-alpha (DAGL-alpha) (DGL-alpha) (Neural stem cell-derived dendrite regulator) (Sn1-specific diacylglycerol lipase alpha) [Durusdinium trenchii]|uniref:sn-1-specific diacylglycerol lipase n=1 Tax=Durusdinium trenchii TaxID=1381693 RepID=A0ABP0LJ47_9DINO